MPIKKKVRILLVDDSGFDRTCRAGVLKRTIESSLGTNCDLTFIEAGTVGEARNALRQGAFDFIMLDASVPFGEETLPINRERPHSPEKPLLIPIFWIDRNRI